MHSNLFDHVNIKPENINIPSGEVSHEKLRKSCISYEGKIKSAGGIDLQILGIGTNGHIGFNEPGSHLNSETRSITLDHLTRFDAAPAFQGIENVPSKSSYYGYSNYFKCKKSPSDGVGVLTKLRSYKMLLKERYLVLYLQLTYNTIKIRP